MELYEKLFSTFVANSNKMKI